MWDDSQKELRSSMVPGQFLRMLWLPVNHAARCASAFLVAALLLAITPGGAAAQGKPSEYAVKAAYLLDFGKFLRTSPLVEAQRKTFDICILGEDPFGQVLDSLAANETLNDRPVRVVRLKRPEDGGGCAIAYVSASEGKRTEQDVEVLAAGQTLTVSDKADFLQSGGMIQFLLLSDHVRFAVNLQPVRRSQLQLSSDLLRVATSVVNEAKREVRP